MIEWCCRLIQGLSGQIATASVRPPYINTKLRSVRFRVRRFRVWGLGEGLGFWV